MEVHFYNIFHLCSVKNLSLELALRVRTSENNAADILWQKKLKKKTFLISVISYYDVGSNSLTRELQCIVLVDSYY